MTDDMLGPSLMHIKYSSYVYDGFCIYDGPIFLVPLSLSYSSSPVSLTLHNLTCSSTHPLHLERYSFIWLIANNMLTKEKYSLPNSIHCSLGQAFEYDQFLRKPFNEHFAFENYFRRKDSVCMKLESAVQLYISVSSTAFYHLFCTKFSPWRHESYLCLHHLLNY